MKKRGRTPTKSPRISQSLRDLLSSGELKEGDRLPSELKLAESFGVARKTVQLALQHLQDDGLIESVPRVGWRVVSTLQQSHNRRVLIVANSWGIPMHVASSLRTLLERHSFVVEMQYYTSTPEKPQVFHPPVEVPRAIVHVSGSPVGENLQKYVQTNNVLILGILSPANTTYDTINCDHFAGTATLLNRLISEGRSSIGFVTSHRLEQRPDSSLVQRRCAYEHTMKQHDFNEHVLTLDGIHDTRESDLQLLNDWLDAHPDLQAIHCCELPVLSHLMVVLQQRGVSLKDDITITAGAFHIPRTLVQLHGLDQLLTVHASEEAIIAAAFDKLNMRLKGSISPPSATLLPARIMNLLSVYDEEQDIYFCQ